MEDGLNIFDSVEFLEPKCSCGSIIKLDETTSYDKNKKVHVCKECGNVVDVLKV